MASGALVTGAAGGFGTAIVERLRNDGLVVALADLPALDATDQASVERMVARVLADHGSLDVLVNSAGVAGPTAPLVDYPPDDFRRVVEVNLTISQGAAPSTERRAGLPPGTRLHRHDDRKRGGGTRPALRVTDSPSRRSRRSWDGNRRLGAVGDRCVQQRRSSS
jgi:NAD(P)-dependent dehydrogenase (short-subunit alcohol dehydrogenase family)